MRYFDLHCDTLYEIYKKGETLAENTCHISYPKMSGFDLYTQVLALWTEHGLTADEGYEQYKKMLGYFKSQYVPRRGFSYRLAVEGGDLLGSDLSRLEQLKRDGVELLTLVWSGDNRIGGAFGSGTGLTPFGKEVVNECIRLGILPDLSHAGDKLFFDAAEIITAHGLPVVATHSNSRSVCRHPRNLTDDMFRVIKESNGLCGISLCPAHLSDSRCDTDAIIRHIDKYLELGGEDAVCMGCDFDGIGSLPDGISSLADIPKLRALMIGHGYSKELIEKIFYLNAEGFFEKHFPENTAGKF